MSSFPFFRRHGGSGQKAGIEICYSAFRFSIRRRDSPLGGAYVRNGVPYWQRLRDYTNLQQLPTKKQTNWGEKKQSK